MQALLQFTINPTKELVVLRAGLLQAKQLKRREQNLTDQHIIQLYWLLWPPDVKNWLIGKDPDARKH